MRAAVLAALALAVGAGPVVAQETGPDDPEPPTARVTPPAVTGSADGVAFEDPRVEKIETHLRCTCGCNLDIWTCQRQMQCGVSPPMSARVRERLAAGAGAEEILDEFVAREGQAILMAPPKEGFNWVGYLLPFFALAGGAVIVAAFVRRRSGASPAPAGGRPEPSADELHRLEAELARLEEEEGL